MRNAAAMFRSLLRVGAAIAFAALLAPATPSAQTPAAGLAYDEIVRVVVNATPPAPGNFQADLAAVNAPVPVAAAATPAPRRGINLGNIAGVIAGRGSVGDVVGAAASDVAGNAISAAMERQMVGAFAGLAGAIQGFLSPHLFRYAYLNGWERVDDVTAQTATIRKCDIGQVIRLDIAKKTYSVYDPNAEPSPTPAPAAPRTRSAPSTPGTPAPPGTGVADVSISTVALGPKPIDNVPTSGYRSTVAFSMSQSTGSCKDASAAIRDETYLSAYTRPSVNSCPLRRAPVPETAREAVAPPPSGGCRPTFTAHNSGPPLPSGKLALYSLVTMSGANGATPAPTASGAPGIGFLTERGNVKTLGRADAVLFDIPTGFTKQ